MIPIKILLNRGVASIPSDYRVGSGDYLEIQLFGQENAGYSIIIGRNGMIQFLGLDQLMFLKEGVLFRI